MIAGRGKGDDPNLWLQCVKAAHACIGDMHLAADAAQAALITVLTRPHQLRDPSAFPGWVHRITQTKARTVRVRTEEVLLEERLDPATDMAADLERRQQMAVVHTAIRALSEPLRGVTSLFSLNTIEQMQLL